jgi:predicted transcriptional regulator
MSWQPGTVAAGGGGGVSTGCESTLAVSDASSGTWTIENFRNGVGQFGPELPGYEET